MNPAYTEFNFPQIRPYPWARLFKQRAPPEAVDLISRMLLYVRTGKWGLARRAYFAPVPHEVRQLL